MTRDEKPTVRRYVPNEEFARGIRDLELGHLDWRNVNGERVAVVPCWGERPECIRGDDQVKIWWRFSWCKVDAFPYRWDELPAVILRAREQNGEDLW